MKRVFLLSILILCLFNASSSMTFNQNGFIESIRQEEHKMCDNQSNIKPKLVAPTMTPSKTETSSIFQTNYFAPYYFSNLKENFGKNIKGSCSYVAVDILLSFYDSYWNDDFIPEKYDGINELINSGNVLDTFNSPGTKAEKDFSSILSRYSNLDYLNVVDQYKDEILHMELLSRGINNYHIYDMEAEYPCGTYLSTMKEIIYDYLDESTSLSRSDVNIVYRNDSNNSMLATVIEKVKQGIPVIVDAKITGGFHSFVVYDYDEKNDELYGNAGRYSSHPTTSEHAHKSFTNFGFSYIQEILYFEPKISHSHSYNYYSINEDGSTISKCACSSVIPSKINVTKNYYLDTSPTFKRDALGKEKWFIDIKLYFEFLILDENRHEIFKKTKINDNEITLSKNEFEQALNLSSNYYYVYIGLASDIDPYWDDYYCSSLFNKPNTYANKSSFLPRDWGFIGRYYFSNELDATHLTTEPERKNTTVTSNGLTIKTDRLRCGYIENSYVVLSPRRENAGRAYFEMNFDKAVYSFMYRACLWSNKEKNDGLAVIQIKDVYDNWKTLKDIPLNVLKTKENGLTQFIEQTPSGIYGLRFEITSTAVGTSNKGRFCIDDIAFSTQSGDTNNTYVNCNYSTKA